MFRPLRNLFRLLGIARTLARYDALFPADWLPATGGLVFAARLLSGFRTARSVRGLRPGERLPKALEALGPSFIKFGQMLSTRPDLVGESVAADLSSLRVAFSTDLGFAPVDARIADTFRDRCGRFASVFREAAWRDPDMAGADEAFEIVRALGFLAAHGANYEKRRDMLGPNIVQNVEQGLGYSAADAARGQVMQTRIFRAFQQFFRDVDVLISPMTSVVPFPVEEWHPVEIGGRTMRTYFHWLAPAYGITLTAHPAISIPCGLDPTGTPFGLQVTGPYRGDRFTLEVAHALELLFRDDPVLARPLPDLAALARAGGRP